MLGTLLGGVGLFLLGMLLLTEGLQALAGDGLRSALRRYTRTRWSAIGTGAAVTALVQSSSATTLAVIGFVGAGLLTFRQSLGIVFGANLGTTTTAWIVAGIGLKVQMNVFALPMVGLGALGRLFGRGKLVPIGTALAGFGLVFVGIDVLQLGMQGLTTRFDPARYANVGVLGYALLVLVGIVMTVIMQSSSAAVATTLAAIAAGSITLDHAAALVIGQNVGTTVTAVVGSLGGSAAAKRTALAHVAFNLLTAVVALLLLPLFVWLVRSATEELDAALQLAAFHTAFNLLGLLIFAPLGEPLARFIERRVPERGEALTRHLAVGQTSQPAVLLEAARLTLRDITLEAAAAARELVSAGATRDVTARTEAVGMALGAVRERLTSIQSDPVAAHERRQHVAVLHAVDHLHRLVEAFAETRNARRALESEECADATERLRRCLDDLTAWLASPGAPEPELEAASREIAQLRRDARPSLLTRTAEGALSPAAAESLLEALRWVDRLAYHFWRTSHHLDVMDHEVPAAPPPAPESRGRRAEESHDMT